MQLRNLVSLLPLSWYLCTVFEQFSSGLRRFSLIILSGLAQGLGGLAKEEWFSSRLRRFSLSILSSLAQGLGSLAKEEWFSSRLRWFSLSILSSLAQGLGSLAKEEQFTPYLVLLYQYHNANLPIVPF